MTRQCRICGCEIPAISVKKYCDSCAYTAKLARKRARYNERADTASRTRWEELSRVFAQFGYSVMSWEKYQAKEGLKE